MDLLDPAKLQLFLLFAVPGIVALYVRAQFLTGRMPPVGEGLVAYVTISLTFHALAFPVLGGRYILTRVQPEWSFKWVIFVFIVPALLGILLGLNARHGWISRILLKLKLVTTHPIGCAWDWRFSGIAECWVHIVLKNETKWAGLLGPNSFISSDPTERDIYLQQVYELDDDNVWNEKSSSVWISHGEIQSIEFWPK